MVLTAPERSKRYRDKLKLNPNKYQELKEKDRQRKIRKQASMTKQEKEQYFCVVTAVRNSFIDYFILHDVSISTSMNLSLCFE
jgi:hypothetical protein